MPLILYTAPGAYNTVSVSPFCTKLECWLRMADIPFETKSGDVMSAPKGKIPFVEIDGVRMGDSQHIIEHLTRLYDVKLDAALTAEQRATGHLIRRALEEGTYFTLMYTRWTTNAGYAIQQPVFAAMMPALVRWFAPALIRRSARKKLHGQGVGRHTEAEVYAMAIADLESISLVLGDRSYLFGDEPTSYDATLFAFVDGIVAFPLDTAPKRRAVELSNLPAYRDRVRARYFPHLS